MSKVGWDEDEDLDIDNVSPDGPPLPPEGKYEVEIESAQPATSKAGKPMIKLEVKLVRFIETGEEFNRTVYDNCPLGKKVAFRVKNLAACFGVPDLRSTGFEAVEAFCENLENDSHQAVANVKYETFEGKTSAKINRYLNPDDL